MPSSRKEEICSRYISAKLEMKSLKEELEEMEKVLRKDIEADFRKTGSVTKTYGSYTISLNEQTRVLADPVALKEAGIFENYSKPSVAEFFKVTRTKG
jgi:hypothetical protein